LRALPLAACTGTAAGTGTGTAAGTGTTDYWLLAPLFFAAAAANKAAEAEAEEAGGEASNKQAPQSPVGQRPAAAAYIYIYISTRVDTAHPTGRHRSSTQVGSVRVGHKSGRRRPAGRHVPPRFFSAGRSTRPRCHIPHTHTTYHGSHVLCTHENSPCSARRMALRTKTVAALPLLDVLRSPWTSATTAAVANKAPLDDPDSTGKWT
jgi:hypothetical protein